MAIAPPPYMNIPPLIPLSIFTGGVMDESFFPAYFNTRVFKQNYANNNVSF